MATQLLHPTPDNPAWVYPRRFAVAPQADGDDPYLADPAIAKLVEFFQEKGVAALKQEDAREQWYEDWLAYQARHRLYASMLSPGAHSTQGTSFDLLRYCRFLETFAYFSPGHGYSLQVSFLGLFAILMGSNAALKQEAVAALEGGGLLAFGVSEKAHGSDLLSNEFRIAEAGPGRFVANGGKYYIGNANAAVMMAILARREEGRDGLVLLALRPAKAPGFGNVRKIRTLGVRAGYVGAFEVTDHELPESDLIARGRQAWDAVLGSVTLGKFFLGFGSVGICEHALQEAVDHLSARNLFGHPVIEMPHIRSAMAEAYARITAMKLYAYRTLDYVRAAGAEDRRYQLFSAVQKAKVSTEGVKAMALLSECIGAKGFEADTYFEMALRDIQLIPGLESSAHINLALTAQFCRRYFGGFDRDLAEPEPLLGGENPYLTEATTGSIHTVAFPPFRNAYRPLQSVANVRLFARQVGLFRLFLGANRFRPTGMADMQYVLGLGRCLATVAYGQLVAEGARLQGVEPRMIAAIFDLLVRDLGAAAAAMTSLSNVGLAGRLLLRRMVKIPRAGEADWAFVGDRMRGSAGG